MWPLPPPHPGVELAQGALESRNGPLTDAQGGRGNPLCPPLNQGHPPYWGGGLGKPYLSRGLVCVGGWVLLGALFAREKSLEGFPSSQGRKMSCVA